MDRKEGIILGGFTPLDSKHLTGFTFLELLIVILVISILSSVAIPTYIRTVERVRAKEAITNLELIRAGEKIYNLENAAYTGNLNGYSAINTNLNLDIEPEFWSYNVTGGASTFSSTSTRDAPGATYDGTIIIDQDGTWSGTSPFVPSN